MAAHGFVSTLKYTAIAAFLAVAAPTEAPAQTTLTDPTNITSPLHPLHPLNPMNPANPGGALDDTVPSVSAEPPSDKEKLTVLFSIIGSIGLTLGLMRYVDGPGAFSPAKTSRKKSPKKGQSFDL